MNLNSTIKTNPKSRLFSAAWITNRTNAYETLWYDYLLFEYALDIENWREVFVKIGGIFEYLILLYGIEKYPSETAFSNKNPKFENMLDVIIKGFNSDPSFFFGNPAQWTNIAALKIFRNMVHTKEYIEWCQSNIDFKKTFTEYLKKAIDDLLEFTF
jgi:hypothetical protein